MILKAQILSIDYNEGECVVHIPQFDIASSTQPAQLTAQFCVPPGVYNGYKVGDAVWVCFEKSLIDEPVVIGQLGVPDVAATATGGAIVGQTLDIKTKAQLPKDTVIKTGESDYDSIIKLVNKVKGLEEVTKAVGDLPNLLTSYQNTLNFLDTKVTELSAGTNTPTTPIDPEFSGRYINPDPLLSDLGGIKAVNHTNGFNMTITDLITELLYPYSAPVIANFSLTPSPSNLFEKGTGQLTSISKATIKLTKKSKDIISLKLLRDGNIIEEQENPKTNENINISLNETTADINTTFELQISDKQQTVKKSLTYSFVYPTFYGLLTPNSIIDDNLITPDSDVRKELHKNGGASYTTTFTTENQCPFIAQPADYKMLEIKDSNNFAQNWVTHNITLTMSDSTTVDYIVYVGGQSTATETYTITFK